MDEIGEHAWFISIVGDALTLFGAFWTARAVLLTSEQATGIAESMGRKRAIEKRAFKTEQRCQGRTGVCSGRSGLPDCQQAHRTILFVSKARPVSDDGETNSAWCGSDLALAAVDGLKRKERRPRSGQATRPAPNHHLEEVESPKRWPIQSTTALTSSR